MKENRITEAFARGRIAYPQFEADAENERRAADTLNGFYRALRDGAAAYIEEIGIKDITFFHTSDEPNEEHLEGYKNASSLLL